MTSSRSPQIDWESLLQRLAAVAKKLFREEGYKADQVIPGTSVLPEDLAADAMIEFFEGTKVKWRPKSDDEDPFPLIVTVMRHNFQDLMRSAGHKRTTFIEDIKDESGQSLLENQPASDKALQDLLEKPTIGLADVDAKLLAEAFYPYAKGDQDLKDVIDAVVYCQCRKRQEIAEWLDISPQEVTDRWRRLRYNYSSATLTSLLVH